MIRFADTGEPIEFSEVKVLSAEVIASETGRVVEIVKEQPFLYNADPNCDHNIISGNSMSGIKCSKCTGWFCY